MGQEEVLQTINKMGFTTIQELEKEIKDCGSRAIVHSLSKLTQQKEIIRTNFGRKTIYFSVKFMEELKNEQ